MAPLSEISSGVASEGGFDVASTMIDGWVNEVYRKAVAKAQWLMRSLEVGPTVAGAATYALPAGVVDLAGLFLPDAATGRQLTYNRTSTEALWAVKAGTSRLAGSGGVFAPAFDSVSVALVELYPVPTTSGLSITALAAMIPTTLTAADTPVIPEDMHGDLKDGAIALGLLRIDERPDAAALFEQRFQTMVGELRKRKNSRVGSGSSRMKVYGSDWR